MQRPATSRAQRHATPPARCWPSKTPPWRSRFLVGWSGWAFSVLAGARGLRAGDRQRLLPAPGRSPLRPQAGAAGQSRPASCDRNGLVLASSVAVPSIWAIPEGNRAPIPTQRQPSSPSCSRCRDGVSTSSSTRTTELRVPARARPTTKPPSKIAALNIKGMFQGREYKRQYPEGEAAAHVVGFTNVEDNGQEGIELAFQQGPAAARPARAASSRTAWAEWSRASASSVPADGRQGHPACRSTARCSSSPTRAARRRDDAQGQGRQRGGARCHHRRGAGAGQLPELRARQARRTSPASSCAIGRSPTSSSPARP